MRIVTGSAAAGLPERAAEFQRQRRKKLFTGLLGGVRTLVEDTHDLQHEPRSVNSARPVPRRHSCESLFPALDSRERGIRRENSLPVQR
jgi:hypothetical protein